MNGEQKVNAYRKHLTWFLYRFLTKVCILHELEKSKKQGNFSLGKILPIK